MPFAKAPVQGNKMANVNYQVFETNNRPIKAWVRGVPMDAKAKAQLENIAALPFIHKWVAVMPDVHLGKGATVGSVIATRRAIIPAAVGVDIGCGMIAARTSLSGEDLDERRLARVFDQISRDVPVGRGQHPEGRALAAAAKPFGRGLRRIL